MSEKPSALHSLLLRIEDPIVFEGETCEYLVAQTRHVGAKLDSILSGENVACNLTRIPEGRLKTQDPSDLSWWRGGLAAIGTLSLGG